MKKIFFALALALGAISCTQEDAVSSTSIIDTSTPELNELDSWLRDNFTTPYNIEVVYKWDAGSIESDLTKNLIPVKYKLVRPLMMMVEKGWMQPYLDIAGEDFFKSYMMKQVFLTGSPGVNSNGTITQGTAEGGRKVVIYQCNDLEERDPEMILRYFHIMHHEFGHILHQTYNYDVTYQLISKGKYLQEWYDITDEEAHRRGFITPYSMSDPNEDFVEMVATLVTNTPEQYAAILDQFPAEGRVIIDKKLALVEKYFTETWGFNVYDLRDAVVEAQAAVVEDLKTVNFDDYDLK